MQSTLLSAIGARDWLQPGLFLVLVLVTWLIFKFAMPLVFDWLTPASEKLEVAAEIAGIMARQAAVRALSIAEARERMEQEVFFAGNQDVSWTERAPRGPVCDFPLPPAALEIFTRFESIQLSFGAAELSRERLQ